MVLSLKAQRKRILAVIILIGIVVLCITLLPKLTLTKETFKGGTEAERTEFLESFGYKISQDPVDVREVTIPKEFSDIYKEYNEMQIAQGFDLLPFRGKVCKQYVYSVLNYPNSDSEVHVTMLVYEGVIIGGDVSSAEINGFMHGFSIDSAHFGLNAENQAEVIEGEKNEAKVNEVKESETEENTEETLAQEIGESEDIYPTD